MYTEIGKIEVVASTEEEKSLLTTVIEGGLTFSGILFESHDVTLYTKGGKQLRRVYSLAVKSPAVNNL